MYRSLLLVTLLCVFSAPAGVDVVTRVYLHDMEAIVVVKSPVCHLCMLQSYARYS